MLNFGLWLIIILMLNMLIAMMAKTFDRIFEKSMVDYQYNFAGFVLTMRHEHAVPPIARLCGLPWTLGKNIYYKTCGPRDEEASAQSSGGHAKLRETFFKESKESQEAGPGAGGTTVIPTNLEAQPAAEVQDVQFQSVVEQPPASSSQASQEPVTAQSKSVDTYELSVQLQKLVEKFLEEHDSDAAFQDEQFRRQVAQKLWKLDSHVEDLIEYWQVNTRRSYKAQRAQLRKKQVARHIATTWISTSKASKNLSKSQAILSRGVKKVKAQKYGKKDTE
ncbi:TRPM1 [Symbiodinium natans]|uniref:TRPM1 protein n=1 Tax=Symbiodinium natans TaxID=878477 RepID=A0A812S0I9_9DINO|nr:TRPM1 [Symbiodinium natans]